MPALHHTQCPKGHLIRTSRDRVSSGGCRTCKQAYDRAYMCEARAARRKLRAVEAALAV